MYEWMGKKKMETFGENHWALSGSLSPRKRVLVNRAREGVISFLSLSFSPNHLFHDIPAEER